MCGRYELETQLEKLESKFRAYSEHFKDINPNWNVAPTQTMPIVTRKDDGRQIELMRWGIPRSIGPDKTKEIINTRSDKAFERFWGSTVRSRRCLIPASGFYEWKNTASGKQPYFIHPKDQDLFAFAGIWSEYSPAKGPTIRTYSIMTTEPNRLMSDIHNRMPVILHEDDYDTWLSDSDERAVIEPLLRPYDDGAMEAYEVSSDVNNVRNNSAKLTNPKP